MRINGKLFSELPFPLNVRNYANIYLTPEVIQTVD